MPTGDDGKLPSEEALDAILTALEKRNERTSMEEELREKMNMQQAVKSMHERIAALEQTLADLEAIDRGLGAEVHDRKALAVRVEELEKDRRWAFRTIVASVVGLIVGIAGWWLKAELGL